MLRFSPLFDLFVEREGQIVKVSWNEDGMNEQEILILIHNG